MRKFLMVGLLAALTACQTVPDRKGFTREQVAALTKEGFRPVDVSYQLGLQERVLFEFNRAELSPSAKAMLKRLASVLRTVGIDGAAVEGHTDSTGPDAYNQDLSERRAAAVKAQLVRSRMRAAAIRAQGLGETFPIASNDTPEGRQENRRVVIIVTPADVR